MSAPETLIHSLAQNRSPYDVSYRPILQPSVRSLQHADTALRALLVAREAALGQAVSWRSFNVGALAVGVSLNGMVSWNTGYNLKPSETSDVNIHAEDIALAKINRTPTNAVALLALSGLPLEDRESGVKPKTLHPCQQCRTMLEEHSSFDHSVPIVSATPDGTAISYGTLRDYQAFHQGETDALKVIEFESGLSLFAPLPIPGDTVTLADNIPKDEKLWTQKFVLPYTSWILENQ